MGIMRIQENVSRKWKKTNQLKIICSLGCNHNRINSYMRCGIANYRPTLKTINYGHGFSKNNKDICQVITERQKLINVVGNM